MSIRVTCPGCHTRFNVSEKFIGKTGPCPKCKKSIKIPDVSDEIKVHEPEHFGPKGQAGAAVLKPVFRKEASVSPVQITLIVAAILAFFAIALILRFAVTDKLNFPDFAEFIFGAILALPLVFAGYTFLRDSELAPLHGQDFWMRLGICAAVYALLWFAMPIAAFMFVGYGVPTWISAFVAMIFTGGMAASMLLQFDFITGVIHYGLYLVVCVLGRWLAGLGALPGMLQPETNPPAPSGGPATDGSVFLLQQLSELISLFAGGCLPVS